jgi:hypothetical protein
MPEMHACGQFGCRRRVLVSEVASMLQRIDRIPAHELFARAFAVAFAIGFVI